MHHRKKFTRSRPGDKTAGSGLAAPLARWAGVTLLGALTLSATGFSTRHAVAADQHRTAHALDGPVSDWVDDMLEVIDAILNGLDDAWVGIGTSAGPLDEPARAQVASDLDVAIALIEQVLDPNQYPSLTPFGVGEIDQSIAPTTLPDYAAQARQLAIEAVQEAESPDIDHQLIGSRLKTIKHLITRGSPHNYRSKAGIEPLGPSEPVEGRGS